MTRLFRGKLWHHKHERTDPTKVQHILEPPLIYQAYARGPLYHEAALGEGKPRVYPADATVRQVLWGHKLGHDPNATPNPVIDIIHLRPTTEKLTEEFPGARSFPLPVLFDTVRDMSAFGRLEEKTKAFTPDLVNLQIARGRLLVPRPYGPRMRPDDVRAVFETVASELELPPELTKRLTSRFIKTRKLTTGTYWIERSDLKLPTPRSFDVAGESTQATSRTLLNKRDIVDMFRDSFPGASDSELRNKS